MTRMTAVEYFPVASTRCEHSSFKSDCDFFFSTMQYKRPAKRVLIQVNMNNNVTCFCGKPSGLLCSLRGVGNENSDKTLSKDVRGKREVNSSTSGDDLESRK